MRTTELQVDVTEAAGLGEPAHIALTVTAPQEVPPDPVVCFAKPGAGYSRGYFTEDLPGPGYGCRLAGRLACRPWLDLRCRRPPRRGRQFPARLRSTVLRPDRGGGAGRRGRGAAEAGGGHPARRARPRVRIRSPSASASRWAARSPSCSRGVTTATTASACSASARCTRSRRRGPARRRCAALGVTRHAAVRGDLHQRAGAGRSRRRRECAGAERRQRHGVGIPLRRRGPRRGAAGHGRLPRPPRRPPSVGVGNHPRHGGALEPGPRLHPGRGRGHPLPRPGCAGRAGRGRRPPRRAARLRVVGERRLLRVPAYGAHAQLRRHPGAVLAAHRDVGRLGTSGPELATSDALRPPICGTGTSPAVTARSPSPSSWRIIRTAATPSDPTTGSASARNGPTLPRAKNMTCDETACTCSVPAASAATSNAAVSSRTNCGPRCSAASGEATSDDNTRQHPMSVGATCGPEDLPERRQVRTVLNDDRLDRHLLEPRRRRADADPLTLGQREHPVRLVRVDDARAAVAHLSTVLEDFGAHLNALHVSPGVEDLAGVDHRVRYRLEVAPATAFGRSDPEHGQQDGAARAPHVAAERDRVVDGTQVHGRPAPPDVAVAEQAAPPPAQLGGVGLRDRRATP